MFQRTRAVRMLFLISLTILILTSGCIPEPYHQEIAPASAILNAGYFNAQDVQVAVGADGSHHLVYTESDGSASRLVYAYQRLAETPKLLTITPSGEYASYYAPDIAVANNGKVYLAWMAHSNTSGYFSCWASITAGTTTVPTCNQLDQSETPSQEKPVLAAHGNTIYVIYTYQTSVSKEHFLMAQRLDNGTIDTHELHKGTENTVYRGYTGKVGSDNTLYAVFTYYESVAKTYTGEFTRYTAGAGHTAYPALLSVSEGTTIAYPSIDLAYDEPTAGNDTAFFAFNSQVTASQISTLHFYKWAFVGSTDPNPTHFLPLDATKDWIISGQPAVAVMGGTPYLAFLAMNNETAGVRDLFSVSIDTTQDPFSASTPLYITDSPEIESVPRVVVASQPMPSDPSIIRSEMIVFYRHYQASGGIYADAVAREVVVVNGDRFLKDPRQVFTSLGANKNTSYEIAGQNDDLFAAWIDVISADNPRTVPWISSNVENVFIPVITR